MVSCVAHGGTCVRMVLSTYVALKCGRAGSGHGSLQKLGNLQFEVVSQSKTCCLSAFIWHTRNIKTRIIAIDKT